MTDILLTAPMPAVERGLESRFTLHRLWQAENREAFLAEVGPRIAGLAISSSGGDWTTRCSRICPPCRSSPALASVMTMWTCPASPRGVWW
jgi:hypothetical protein